MSSNLSGSRSQQTNQQNRGPNIPVCLRVRPINQAEISLGNSCVAVSRDAKRATFDVPFEGDPSARRKYEFTFDNVIGESTSPSFGRRDSDVYCTSSLVKSFLNGHECHLIAYGTSGSGKTHSLLCQGAVRSDIDDYSVDKTGGVSSMMSVSSLGSCGVSELVNRETSNLSLSRGIVHNVIAEIFDSLPHGAKLIVSAVEIVDNKLSDLLETDDMNKGTKRIPGIDVGPNGSTVIIGSTEVECYSVPKTFDLLCHAFEKSRRCSTGNKAQSHVVFALKCDSKLSQGCFYIVNVAGLAGGNDDGFVSNDLQHLSKVLKSVLHNKPLSAKSSENLITRLLADPLSGKARASLVITVSPCDSCLNDSFATIKFGQRIRRIEVNFSERKPTLKNEEDRESNIRNDPVSEKNNSLDNRNRRQNYLGQFSSRSLTSNNRKITPPALPEVQEDHSAHQPTTTSGGPGTDLADVEEIEPRLTKSPKDITKFNIMNKSNDLMANQTKNELNDLSKIRDEIKNIKSEQKTTEIKHDYKGDKSAKELYRSVNSMLDKVERSDSKSSLGDLETVVKGDPSSSNHTYPNFEKTGHDTLSQTFPVRTLNKNTHKWQGDDTSATISMSGESNDEIARYNVPTPATRGIDSDLADARNELASLNIKLKSATASIGADLDMVDEEELVVSRLNSIAQKTPKYSKGEATGLKLNRDIASLSITDNKHTNYHYNNSQNTESFAHETSEHKDRLLIEMEKEMEALKRENNALNLIKRKKDEELSLAKKEIKILSLREEEAKDRSRILCDDDLDSPGNWQMQHDNNLAVSNVMASRYNIDNDIIPSQIGENAVDGMDEHLNNNSQENNFESGEPIRVYLRLRPMSKLEASRRSRCCIEVYDGSSEFTVDSPLDGEYDFSYDRVFNTDACQSEVYEYCGSPVVTYVLAGMNCAVVAYGLSGSGKTYSLTGSLHSTDTLKDESIYGSDHKHDDIDEEGEEGITPRLIKDLFNEIAMSPESIETTIKCSYVAIFLEKIFDLLEPNIEKNLFVRETGKGIHIDGASEAYCFCEQDAIALLQRGVSVLSILSDRMNIDTSRAHSMIIVKVQRRNTLTGRVKESDLFVTDFAGFEMAGNAPPDRTIQETKIGQKSFSALSNVIKALIEGNTHIPYRDSKLTSLLKSAFGGNCRTTLLITASPSSYKISETINPIQLGQRVRRIINMPKVNEDVSCDEYRKWLMSSEMQRGELVSFVKELAKELVQRHQKNEKLGESHDVLDYLSGPLWESVKSIVREDDKEHNPCREALALGRVDQLQKNMKWKSLSQLLSRTLPSEELTNAIDDKNRTASHLTDIQSEVVVLRRQNKLLSSHKKESEEDVVKARKQVKMLSLRKSQLEHNLVKCRHQEKITGKLLRHLRNLCWKIQSDYTNIRSTEISQITEGLNGIPDLTGLVDIDTLLLEAGIIESRQIPEKDMDFSDDLDPAENEVINSIRSDRKSSVKAVPKGSNDDTVSERELQLDVGFPDRDKNDDTLSVGSNTSQTQRNLSFLKDMNPLTLVKANKGNWLANSKRPTRFTNLGENSDCSENNSFGIKLQRQMERELRIMHRKCIDLQMHLNEEKGKVHVLTNKSKSLQAKRLTQETLTLRTERDNMMQSAQAAIWKIEELHLVNQILDHGLAESQQQLDFQEECFQRLQETFRTTVIDSLEGDSRLRERIEELLSLLESLSVPQLDKHDILGTHEPQHTTCMSLNLALKGHLHHSSEGYVPSANKRLSDQRPHQDYSQMPPIKNPERMPKSVRRYSKYRRPSRRFGDSYGGKRKHVLRMKARAEHHPILFAVSTDFYNTYLGK